MLVSIVIDNHNYGRYLGQAIDSALRQSAAAVEVIVVDDGSTDNSRDVMLGYGDRIVPVFQANGGQASAVNAGFARSHGQIVIFLDADDILLPMAAARATAVFAAQPGTAKVQYRMSVVDAQGRPTGAIRPPPHIPLQSGDLRRQEVSFPFDLPWAAMSANAFSAAVLQQIMPVPAARYGRAGADWYLAHVAALFGEVCALDEVCALYRIHGANQYAPTSQGLSLDRIRQSLRYADATRDCLQQFADQLRLARPDPILSVSDLAGRLTSLKLCRERHPFSRETPARLVGLGLRASARRFDVRWPAKLIFMAWFLVMGLAPRAAGELLAEAFFAPDRRNSVNAWLSRWGPGAAG
jgi:glycosyltransferase involved in cell wall biosynthesis